MKLEGKTLQILKNFSTINQSLLFKPGNTLTTCTPNKTMMAKATIKEDIPSQFAIYDISRLLGVLSLFDSPEITINEKDMSISTGTQEVSYTFADPSVIVVPGKEVAMPECEIQFHLTDATLQSVLKAMGVLQLPELAITGKDGKMYIEAINHKNTSCDTYRAVLKETDRTFRMIFRAEHLKFIPGNYDVSISSKGIAMFVGVDATYWVATEASSTFEQ